MTRGRQNRPDRMDTSTATAVLSLRPAPDATTVALAGGESTRFGPGHKALTTLGGEPLIRHVVGTPRAVTSRSPIVAVRTADQRERLVQALPKDWDMRFVHDDPGLSGPLTGVTAAANTVTTSWLFVADCNMSLLKPHAMAVLLECAARSDGDRDRDRDRHVSTDGDRPSPPAIVPVSGRSHEPLHALYRRAAVRNNVSELAPDDNLGAPLNRLDDIEYVGFDTLPENVDRSVTNANTRTELAWVATGDEVRR